MSESKETVGDLNRKMESAIKSYVAGFSGGHLFDALQIARDRETLLKSKEFTPSKKED